MEVSELDNCHSLYLSKADKITDYEWSVLLGLIIRNLLILMGNIRIYLVNGYPTHRMFSHITKYSSHNVDLKMIKSILYPSVNNDSCLMIDGNQSYLRLLEKSAKYIHAKNIGKRDIIIAFQGLSFTANLMMVRDLARCHPEINILVEPGHRDFNYQKNIYDRDWIIDNFYQDYTNITAQSVLYIPSDYKIYCLENTHSVDYTDIEYPDKIAMIIGSEQNGITPELLDSNTRIRIPSHHCTNSSLNAIATAAIIVSLF
jgi:hypothetical protein